MCSVRTGSLVSFFLAVYIFMMDMFNFGAELFVVGFPESTV